jgi:hypothetical protein
MGHRNRLLCPHSSQLQREVGAIRMELRVNKSPEQ